MSTQTGKILISPSLLAADYMNLSREVERVEQSGADMLHFDVMDGVFVPNINFGLPLLRALRKRTALPIDVHLMLCDPSEYIEAFADAGADIISVHLEATYGKTTDVVDRITAAGCKASVAVSPETPVQTLFPLLSELSMALVMTVNPGYGGQKLIQSTLEKIRLLREYITNNGFDCDIEADGGINDETVGSVKDAGANVLVIGSAMFGKDDMKAAAENYRK